MIFLVFLADGDGGVIDCGCFGLMSGFEVASTLGALGLALWWFIVRNAASYAWVLQVTTLDGRHHFRLSLLLTVGLGCS